MRAATPDMPSRHAGHFGTPARALLALLFASLSLASGCGGDRDGGEVRVLVAGEGADARLPATELVAEATRMSLIGRDTGGQAIPGLASSWRFVDDGHSLILRLKPLRWSDRRPVSATDAAAGLRTAIAAPGGEVLAAGLGGVVAITAPTQRVVEIRLAAADPALVGWLALPQAGITRRGAILGPYRLQAGEDGPRRLVRVAAAAEEDAKPAVMSVDSRSDSTAAIAAFVRGEADVVIGAGLAGLADARVMAPAPALRLEAAWGVYGYVANTHNGPLSDPRVRQALAMAVDRSRVVAGIGINGVAPAIGLTSPALWTGDPPTPSWAALDLAARQAAAARLLQAAGYTAAKPLALTLLLLPGRDHQAIAAAVGDDWRTLGVRVTVSVAAAADFTDEVARGEYDLALAERSVPVADPAPLLRRFGCHAARSYCNRDADALITESYRQESTARRAMLAQAETMMLADTPFVPLFTPLRWALVSPRVTGWVPNAAGAHPLGRLSVR